MEEGLLHWVQPMQLQFFYSVHLRGSGLIRAEWIGLHICINTPSGHLLTSSVFLIIASLLRYPLLYNLSRTVITGYITAAACLIVANQGRHVLGISTTEETRPPHF